MSKDSDYRCPQKWHEGFEGDDRARLGWFKEALQEGTNFLKLQRAHSLIEKCLDVIGGWDKDDLTPSSLSDVNVNYAKRQAREIVATLSNLRPVWGFKTDNEIFQKPSAILNKINASVFEQARTYMAIKKAMQWACISTGYLGIRWERDRYRFGHGDIAFDAYGPNDVYPIQLPKDHDLQKAYAVVMRTEVPIALAHAMYPKFADKIKANRSTPSNFNGVMDRMKQMAKRIPRHLMDILNSRGDDHSVSGPTVDIYYTYIMDQTINTSLHPVQMGVPGSSWYYEVPYLGQQVPVHSPDGIKSREATEEDCLLYPLRRLLICTDSCIMEDDTSPWWHGQVPIVKFTLDEWPDQYLGYSVIHDVWTLQKAMNQNFRGFQDYVNKALRPDVTWDPNKISKSTIEAYDPRIPGQRIPVNSSLGEAFKLVQMPGVNFDLGKWHDILKNTIDHMMAIPDMKDMAKANQIPSQETLDKLKEIAGPIIQDISRSMEESLRQLGEMEKGLIYQFYTTKRRISLLGKDGLVEEDLLFNPEELVPQTFVSNPNLTPKFLHTDAIEKARQAMGEVVFRVTPGSALEITQTTYKMYLLQLWRDQRFPIDPWTLAEALHLPMFGEPPTGAVTMMDRWKAWQDISTKMKLMQMMEAARAQAAAQQGMVQPDQQGLAGMVEQAIQAHKQGQEGRPPSGQKPPHMEERKDAAGVPRQVIAES